MEIDITGIIKGAKKIITHCTCCAITFYAAKVLLDFGVDLMVEYYCS